MQLADVCVIQRLHARDFAVDCHSLVFVLQLRALVDLDCDSLFGHLVLSKSHRRSAALPQHSNDLVLSQLFLRLFLVHLFVNLFASFAENVVFIAQVDATLFQIVQALHLLFRHDHFIIVRAALVAVHLIQLLEAVLELRNGRLSPVEWPRIQVVLALGLQWRVLVEPREELL